MSDLRRVLHAFWSACYWFPINTAFAAYLLENAILVLSRGGALSLFFKLHRAVFYEPLGPTVGQLQLPPPPPQKKERKLQLPDECSGEMGMVEIDWAILKDRLCQKKVRDSRGRVDMGHYLSREVRVELDRQCWTDLSQKHITPKRITLSQSSGFLGNQSKFTS